MKIILFFLVAFVLPNAMASQSAPAPSKSTLHPFQPEARGKDGLRVMFYNVENLYDTVNDSLTQDEEFLPEGIKHWTPYRYQNKLNQLAKVIIGVGGWEAPDLIGLCEIENRQVVEDLIRRTPLRNTGYAIAHENSADVRGVDVALLYNPDKFRYLSHDTIRPRFPFDTLVRTRDVLYVKGLACGTDTLHVFVNHWPSRRGGVAASEPRRTYVAGLIRTFCDSILTAQPDAKILIMGDMNDEADNISLSEVLRARNDAGQIKPGDFYGYMHHLGKTSPIGTEKYRDHWGLIDHILVSAALYQGSGLKASPAGAAIYQAPYLLVDDETNFGLMPSRTYVGPNYKGGFSDHLPVYIDLVK